VNHFDATLGEISRDAEILPILLAGEAMIM